MTAAGRVARWTAAAALFVSPALAQHSSFRNYAHDEGLTNLDVRSLLQDRAGFIWVGTEDGLFRYDGHRFVRYGMESGLPTVAVTSLVESPDGELWVSTQNGFGRRVGGQFIKAAPDGNNSVQGEHTLAPAVGLAHEIDGPDREVGVYAGTARGLLRLIPGKPAALVPGSGGRRVWAVLADRTGKRIWYASGMGICRWDGEENQCFGDKEGLPQDHWGGLGIDSDGTVWARSGGQLAVIAAAAQRFEVRTPGLPSSPLNGALEVDSAGQVMIPTDAGLAQWNGKTWSLITRSEGLVVASTTVAMEDREGSLWIGMRGGGLARRLGAMEWESWTADQGLSNDQVWAISRESAGSLLVGTGSGLYRLLERGAAERRIQLVDSLKFGLASNRIRAIASDTDGSIWLGTAPGGMARLDKKTGVVTRINSPFSDSLHVLAVIVDRHHNVWAGGDSLYRITRTASGWSWQRAAIPGGGENETFFDLREDRDGRIWAAGDEGLAVWDGSVWTRFRPPFSNLPRLAQHLALSRDGSVWASFRDSSQISQISRSNDQWLIGKTPADPAGARDAANPSSFLGFDQLGHLWRGTGSGVSMLSGDHWVHYDRADGLVWDDTTANAFFSDADGSVWIGTSRGLSQHRPAPYVPLRLTPPVIVNVRSGERDLGMPRPLRLDYRAGSFTVQYSALTFRREQDVRFRYRLKGWNSQWMETQDWEASFGGVGPGDYVFEVNAGVWGEGWAKAVASVPITIAGPLWMTLRFRVALTVFSVALLLIFWRARERVHRGRESELATAVSERTDEIERQREREHERNQILEMLVSNQPLGMVLDRALRFLSSDDPGMVGAVLLRHGGRCRVASSSGFPAEWLAAIQMPRAVPFEVWQEARYWNNPGLDPAWQTFLEHINEPGPARLYSKPIFSGDSAIGAILHTCSAAPQGSEAGVDLTQPLKTAETVSQLVGLAFEHNRLYENLQFQAMHDALTGLANRAQFEECLKRHLKEAEALQHKLAVLFVDLDRFKEVNDTLSHGAGDLYLCEIADRMKKTVRGVDVVARIGGDEFTVLLPDIEDELEASTVAERILAAIQQPLHIGGREFRPTASAGVAVYPDDGLDADQLQRYADKAMYSAKESGRNRVQTFASRNETLDRARLEDELRLALRDQHFVVHYQAKVAKEGRLMGFEALVRLNHPKFGIIPPLEFIPAAERSGLIMPIGAWVLEEVCSQIALWRSQGHGEIAVAVNVSPVQLSQPDFADSVAACLRRHDVSPWHLELELTESVLVTGSEHALRQMRQLRALGVRISLDDFGTGYSSLSYLHRLEVDTVKLDKSFVQPIENDKMARWLVQAMIGMAQGLGLEVVAEGVETDGQRTALIAAGCPVMQGYLFARPLPACDLEPLLRLATDIPYSDRSRPVDIGASALSDLLLTN